MFFMLASTKHEISNAHKNVENRLGCFQTMLITRTLVKSVYQKCNILISQPKHMVWVLKRSLNETVLLSTQKIC